jgi:hypothetical protein
VLAVLSHLLIDEADAPDVAESENAGKGSDGNEGADDEGAAGSISVSQSVFIGGVMASVWMAL